jgi:hypothetical protein
MAKGAGGNAMQPGMDYAGAAQAAQNAMGSIGSMRKPKRGAAGKQPPMGDSTGGRDWANALPGLISNANQQRMMNPGMPAPGGMPTPSIPFNKPMPTMRQPMMGGDNNYAQMLAQRAGTGINPAYQNTVMNRLRPTMDSNQNVPPLDVTNPRMASAGPNAAMQRVAQLRKTHQYGF